MRRYAKLVDIAVLAAILIGLFVSSSQPYYKQDMRGTISKVVDEKAWGQRLHDVSVDYGGREISVAEKGTAGFIEFFMRKGIHFSTFALLALMWYRVLRHRLDFVVALPWSAFLSLLTAVLDEWHQTFTPDRTGMVGDVVLDATGSATMLLVIILIRSYRIGKTHDKM